MFRTTEDTYPIQHTAQGAGRSSLWKRAALLLLIAVLTVVMSGLAGGHPVFAAANGAETASVVSGTARYYRIQVTKADGSLAASYRVKAETAPDVSAIRLAITKQMKKQYDAVQKVSIREDRITVLPEAETGSATQRKNAAAETAGSGAETVTVDSLEELAQKLAQEESLEVTTVQKQTKKVRTSFRTVRRRSAKYRKTTRTVKAGKKGVRTKVYHVTWKNGKKISRKLVSSRISRKAKARQVIIGTGTVSAPKSRKLSGTEGSDVAKFALRFVGNPYRYGGCSLTSGTDCSGFVMAVYRHFGVSMGHSASTQRAYGTGVSVQNAKPGDIVCYPGHVGIYIGNGKIVHAMDPAHGITISKLHYSGKAILTVRRVFA